MSDEKMEFTEELNDQYMEKIRPLKIKAYDANNVLLAESVSEIKDGVVCNK